jgi:hypothetical protein
VKTDVRDTSIEAYRDLRVRRLLAPKQQLIMDAMRRWGYGNYSLQELSKWTALPINTVSGRCNELKKAGHLEEAPKRKCSITGRTIHPLRIKT